MNVCKLQVLAIAAMLVLTCSCSYAQPAAPTNPPLPDRELVVAIREVPPFATKNRDGTWRGISIDLWRRLADRLHLRYRFSEQPANRDIIDGVAKGEFDVGARRSR